MTPLIKNVLVIAGLVGLAAFGYYLFILNSESDITTAEGSLVTNQAAAEAQEFLVRLQQLQQINFTDSIFSDPRFRSLVDFSEELNPVPIGRSNPFAPATNP